MLVLKYSKAEVAVFNILISKLSVFGAEKSDSVQASLKANGVE